MNYTLLLSTYLLYTYNNHTIPHLLFAICYQLSTMRLFTRQFVKDIFTIALFLGAFYLLVNNPLTHPKPVEKYGVWSIQLMQQPIVFGIAGHNFLTLRDEKNTIVGELHGLATNAKTGKWKYIGNNETDKLQVWYFKNSYEYVTQKKFSGIVLFTGEKDEANKLWNKALACKEKINKQELLYPPYGVNLSGDTENSNSVAYTLTFCMGLDAEHLGLITPGWGKNLLVGK